MQICSDFFNKYLIYFIRGISCSCVEIFDKNGKTYWNYMETYIVVYTYVLNRPITFGYLFYAVWECRTAKAVKIGKIFLNNAFWGFECLCHCSVSFVCSSVSEVIGQMSAKQQQRTTKCMYYYYVLVVQWVPEIQVLGTHIVVEKWV